MRRFVLDTRYWILDTGYSIIDTGCSISSVQNPVSSIQHPASSIKHRESGFTLIEIMVATVITMMIIGSVYAAFRTSLNVYQRDEAKIIMLQRCRVALDRMARDTSNLFYVADDEELTLMAEDVSDNETSLDKDMISFVAIVNPKLDDYAETAEAEEAEASVDEEEENKLPSDLSRIVYYVGSASEDETVQSLIRIETPNLDTEEFQSMLEELMSSSVSEEMQEQLQSSVLIDYVSGLNIRYSDGSEWVDTWDMEEQSALPSAVEITLTITDADTQKKTLTEAVVVYLPMSEPATEETAAGVAAQQ